MNNKDKLFRKQLRYIRGGDEILYKSFVEKKLNNIRAIFELLFSNGSNLKLIPEARLRVLIK